MKTASFTFLALLLTAGGAAAQDSSGEASWEEQINVLGFQIIHLSTINALNGLNLDREQIVKLRDLARQVEDSGAKVPEAGGKFSPELADVHKTYDDLRGILLRQEKITDDLRRRVMKARANESGVLRKSLVTPRFQLGGSSCTRCHADPSAGNPPQNPFGRKPTPKEIFVAHSVGLYTWRGFLQMARASKQVDAILTDEQRTVFSDFACCLIPPENLNNPVRVGQAPVPDWADDLLKKVRGIPDAQWSRWRKVILDSFAGYKDMTRPGVTKDEKEEVRERIGKVLDEARGMSDIDFELSKEDLCKRLSLLPAGEDHVAKRAYFLLSPGTVEVYDELLKRLDRKPQITRPAAHPEAEKPKCREGRDCDPSEEP